MDNIELLYLVLLVTFKLMILIPLNLKSFWHMLSENSSKTIYLMSKIIHLIHFWMTLILKLRLVNFPNIPSWDSYSKKKWKKKNNKEKFNKKTVLLLTVTVIKWASLNGFSESKQGPLNDTWLYKGLHGPVVHHHSSFANGCYCFVTRFFWESA